MCYTSCIVRPKCHPLESVLCCWRDKTFAVSLDRDGLIRSIVCLVCDSRILLRLIDVCAHGTQTDESLCFQWLDTEFLNVQRPMAEWCHPCQATRRRLVLTTLNRVSTDIKSFDYIFLFYVWNFVRLFQSIEYIRFFCIFYNDSRIIGDSIYWRKLHISI